MIEVQHLTKQYGRVLALDAVNFKVPAAQAYALWGHNGAGKSTTLKALLGLIHYQGRVSVMGYDVTRYPREARRLIGYVPQDLAYYDMTVAQTLDFFGALKRVSAAEGLRALAEVGLAGELAKTVGALSGGMRQRLALALAVLGDPPVLLLDEPTANLDAAARRDLMAMLLAQKRAGKTILFASHRPEEARELADQVLWLEGGRLSCTCTPAELQQRTAPGETWLRVRLQENGVEHAERELTRRGFGVRRSGRCVLVQVERSLKAAPLTVLERAGIAVADFEVEREGESWMPVH